MTWIKNRSWPVQFALALAIGFVIGATASAGTLYSWKTEDGTYAYTNDKKRIPARYKGQAKTSQLKSMEDYDRFTPGPERQTTEYGDRLKGRLSELRQRPEGPTTFGAQPIVVGQQGPMVTLQGGGRRGSNGPGLALPIGPMDGDDPIIVEDVRMKPAKGHNTTRHFQIVRKGDKVVAVRKGRFNDTKPGGQREETEFDSDPIAR